MKIFPTHQGAVNKNRAARRAFVGCMLASVVALGLAGPAPSAEKIDLAAWREMPVYDHGRIKPLDTLATEVMNAVCNRSGSSITFTLEGYIPSESLSEERYAGARRLFPDNPAAAAEQNAAGKTPRPYPKSPLKLSTEGLFLSWLVSPDDWEEVPFIYAPHENLRKKMGWPVEKGVLKYVSPQQIERSEELVAYLLELNSRQENAGAAQQTFEPTPLDKLVQEMLERYSRFRTLTLNPQDPLTHSPVKLPGSRTGFIKQLSEMLTLARKQNTKGQTLAGVLQMLAQLDAKNQLSIHTSEMLAALQACQDIAARLFESGRASLGGVSGGQPIELAEARDAVIRLDQAAVVLEKDLTEQFKTVQENAKTMPSSQAASLFTLFRELSSKAKELNRLAQEMHYALYDDGGSLMVVPSLNAAALAKHRETRNTAQPWLSLPAVLYGDDTLLAPYPAARIAHARTAWKRLVSAYRLNANNAQRGPAIAEAQRGWVESVRALGEAISPLREELVRKELSSIERDSAVLAYTAYPAPQQMEIEVRYNRTDPFLWSWVLSLLATFCFALSFGVARKPMFWVAVSVMFACLAWTTYGFYMRVMITGWAPVTNMYETVVYVPYFMSWLGAGFLLLPMLSRGMSAAWRANALPFAASLSNTSPGAGEAQESSARSEGSGSWQKVFQWGALLPRIGLMAFFLFFLSVWHYADGGRPIFQLLPNLDAAGKGGLANQIGVWAVGLTCLSIAVWFGPRIVLMAVSSPFFIPLSWRQPGAFRRMISEVYPRQGFGIAATLGGFLFYYLAWYAPVLNESFSPLQPVLRSNFWLTIHVLTIVSSYGAGLLAWMLGLGAICYYLFGKYRDPVQPSKLPAGMAPANPNPERVLKRRPPEEVAALAGYSYKAVQVAVLLLAVGTILGGLWADVSWGRFWGWDPKEVWALISLLVYLSILHGRFAGWFHNFGMAFGTVFGASMIAMSWYGVNFGLPKLAGGAVGLHSYGEGAGGLEYVVAFVAVNWGLLIAAALRYRAETHVASAAKPTPPDTKNTPSDGNAAGKTPLANTPTA